MEQTLTHHSVIQELHDTDKCRRHETLFQVIFEKHHNLLT